MRLVVDYLVRFNYLVGKNYQVVYLLPWKGLKTSISYTLVTMQLKAFQEKNGMQEKTPNLAEGQRINRITAVDFKDTKYRNKDGGMQQVALLTTDTGVYHTTAKAIVDTLRNYFVEGKNTEPLENIEVVETRSKDGRNYLELKGF